MSNATKLLAVQTVLLSGGIFMVIEVAAEGMQLWQAFVGGILIAGSCIAGYEAREKP